MLVLKKMSNAFAAIVCSRRVTFTSYDSQGACVRIAAVVLAAAALSGTAEADITTMGDVTPTYPSDDPEPPDPWLLNPNVPLHVGETDTGELTIRDGSVVVGGYTYIGHESTGSGVVTVTGAGSTWEADSPHVNVGVIVGNAGAGTLVISEGGSVTTAFRAALGGSASGLGTASVTGAGSSWRIAGWLEVGGSGSGVLSITNGGLVSAETPDFGGDINIARWAEGSYGAVLVDHATLESNARLVVGFLGTGFLTIQNGGQVRSAAGHIGLGSNGNGTATVTGSESRWVIDGSLGSPNSLGRLVVGSGSGGTGVLEIADGAEVSSSFGNISGTNSNVTVTGSGSAWVNLSRLDMSEKGSLTIEAQGRVASRQGHLFDESNVKVTGSGSTWNSSVFLELRNKASLTIEAQGHVRSNIVVVVDESRIELEPGSGANLQLGASAPPVLPGSQTSRVSIGGPFGDLRLQGGTVQTEELNLTSSETGRGQLRGNGYVTGLVNTLPQGTLAPIQGLRNAGTITAEGDYLNQPEGWSSASGQAQLWLDGNFVQEANGTLELTVTEDNRTTASSPKIPVRISGHAHLNGKLQVSHAGVVTSEGALNAGDRFHLMEWNSLTGRFREFSGSTIQNRDDVFFGLNYTDQGLELITLETPRTSGGNVFQASTARNLFVVAPGLPGQPSDLLAQSFAAKLSQFSNQSWDVVQPDWSKYGTTPNAGSVFGEFFDDPFGSNVRTRHEAARIVHEIGESTAFWMQENQLNDYDSIHVVTASGGSWFADGFIDRLKALGLSGAVQLTILDGYHTSGVRVAGDGQTVQEEIGDTADYVEHYFHRGFGADGTGALLDNALNINVTALDPKYLLVDLFPNPKFHQFPMDWYLHSVNTPFARSTHEYGFKNSISVLGGLPTTASPGKNRFFSISFADALETQVNVLGVSELDVYTGTRATTLTVTRFGELIDLKEVPLVVSDTGTIDINDDGELRLATGSPAIATLFIDLLKPASFFEFDIDFLSQSAGMLSFWIDGNSVLSLDESMFALLNGSISTGPLALPHPLEAGMHTIILRLDPGAGAISPSEVLISNLAFSRLEIVPEPSGMVLTVMAIFVTLLWHNCRTV